MVEKDQIFQDRKKKLYFKAFGCSTLFKLTKDKSPLLFDYIIVNYSNIAKKYTEKNKDSIFFGKPVDIYLSDDKFQTIKKELRIQSQFNTSRITIGFGSNQTLCYIYHESMKPVSTSSN